ncbi:MAG: hypothetical protein UW09_C0003G0229 [candidate division TM6 bacterium GW2011_GWF2_43_87]|nr:MAG: hypothetical protein UW09_C0003G0229 [candidate division TM6 bacterium GW2011_GWF2_43_87]
MSFLFLKNRAMCNGVYPRLSLLSNAAPALINFRARAISVIAAV